MVRARALALGLGLAVLSAGCFSPSFGQGQFLCGPAPDRACPPGQSCGPAGRCVADPGRDDGGPRPDRPSADLAEEDGPPADSIGDQGLPDRPLPGDGGDLGPDLLLPDAPPPDGPPIEPGLTCSGAALIGPGVYVGTTRGRPRSLGTTCIEADGGQVVYSILVPPGQQLEAALEFEAGFDGTVELHAGPAAACDADPASCLTAADATGDGGPERVTWFNPGSDSAQIFIVIAGFGDAGGGYQLTTRLFTSLPGETCSNAEPIGPGILRGQTTVGYNPDFGFGPGCRGTRGRDRVYRIDVPSSTELTVTATPTDGADVSVNLVLGPDPAACGPEHICVAGENVGGPGESEQARYTNNALASMVGARTIFIIVDDAVEGGVGGAYDLEVTLEPVPTPPAGATCQTAIEIADGEATSGSLGGGSDYGPDPTCATVEGPDRVYRISVPAMSTLIATVAPDADLDATLSLLEGPDAAACDRVPKFCLTSTDDQPVGMPETVSWFNDNDRDVDVFIIVDGYGPGSFSLSVNISF